MKLRGLVVAAFVFFILAGILYWSEHHKPAEEAVQASVDAPPAILKLDASAIDKLELKKKDTEPIVLTKDASGKWQIVQPKPLSADQSTMLGMISTLSSLNSERVVVEDTSGLKPSDLKQYGLDVPALSLEITEKGNRIHILRIGDGTPTGAGVYAGVAGNPKIFTIAAYAKGSVDKNLNDLRNKKVFDFGFVEPNKVEMHVASKAYFLTRSGDDWWQDGKKLDNGSMQSLISKLRDLAADQFPDSGFANPIIEVTVMSGDGKQIEKVLIAKSSDGYVAKRENEPTLYRLNSSSVDDLQKAAAEVKPEAPARSKDLRTKGCRVTK
jgi:Domain of unknown function (DUF4340)